MGFETYKPTIVMIALQFMYATITLCTRATLVQGLSVRVFVVYRQTIAFLLIAPIALGPRYVYSLTFLPPPLHHTPPSSCLVHFSKEVYMGSQSIKIITFC